MSEQPQEQPPVQKRPRGITSEQAKNTWENPEIRAKRVEAMKAAGLERRKKNGHVEVQATSTAQTINAQVEPTQTQSE